MSLACARGSQVGGVVMVGEPFSATRNPDLPLRSTGFADSSAGGWTTNNLRMAAA